MLDVTVEVDDASVGANPDDSASLAITVTDVNDPPTVSLINVLASLAENADTGSPVTIAQIVVNDDGQGTNSLSLSGADAASFEIVGTELRLKAGTPLDFETQSSYQIKVEVDDPSVVVRFRLDGSRLL